LKALLRCIRQFILA